MKSLHLNEVWQLPVRGGAYLVYMNNPYHNHYHYPELNSYQKDVSLVDQYTLEGYARTAVGHALIVAPTVSRTCAVTVVKKAGGDCFILGRVFPRYSIFWPSNIDPNGLIELKASAVRKWEA